jgi:hypothetical protein
LDGLRMDAPQRSADEGMSLGIVPVPVTSVCARCVRSLRISITGVK